jgi:DNA-directed RNA polymerase subunit D
MPVRLLRLEGNRISLLMEGYSVAFANAIRRLALSDVPTMAVDTVIFYDNTSGIYEEIIAHRMGLVVLRSDEALRRYKPPEECSVVEPPNPDCYVEIFLEKEIPEDSVTGEYVKASDMQLSDPSVSPVYPETPIVYLAPGQRIHVVAYARLGRGSEHGKWSPASVAVLKYTPIVRYDSSRVSEACIKCLDAYPEVVEAISRGGSGELELLKDDLNTSGLLYCAEAQCSGALSVDYDRRRLMLVIESTGALRPERIVYEASRALSERVKRLREELELLREEGGGG